MRQLSVLQDQTAEDRLVTLRNRSKLAANPNLLHWYRELYRGQFEHFPDPDGLRILEIGSGVSPLKRFRKNVITSDVLELDHLDYVFDCHTIDRFDPIESESLDVIALTNVLHHLHDPIDFLNRSASKLKRGGKIIATEPYFSILSNLIFSYLHQEPVDFAITEPVLDEIRVRLHPQISLCPGSSLSGGRTGATGCERISILIQGASRCSARSPTWSPAGSRGDCRFLMDFTERSSVWT